MTGCPTCGTPLPAARSLVADVIERTLAVPRGSWSCPGCLGVVVEDEHGEIATRVSGSVVIRAIEHLRRAAEDGRLEQEAQRLSADPQTWFVARVPEVFALFGWRPGLLTQLTETCFVVAPVPADRAVATDVGLVRTAEMSSRHVPDYAVLCRRFEAFPASPEVITPRSGWERLPGWLADSPAIPVVSVDPPTVTLTATFPPGGPVFRVKKLVVYADAVVPFRV